jgi:hypothetical protein
VGTSSSQALFWRTTRKNERQNSLVIVPLEIDIRTGSQNQELARQTCGLADSLALSEPVLPFDWSSPLPTVEPRAVSKSEKRVFHERNPDSTDTNAGTEAKRQIPKNRRNASFFRDRVSPTESGTLSVSLWVRGPTSTLVALMLVSSMNDRCQQSARRLPLVLHQAPTSSAGARNFPRRHPPWVVRWLSPGG